MFHKHPATITSHGFRVLLLRFCPSDHDTAVRSETNRLYSLSMDSVPTPTPCLTALRSPFNRQAMVRALSMHLRMGSVGSAPLGATDTADRTPFQARSRRWHRSPGARAGGTNRAKIGLRLAPKFCPHGPPSDSEARAGRVSNGRTPKKALRLPHEKLKFYDGGSVPGLPLRTPPEQDGEVLNLNPTTRMQFWIAQHR
jgi:hypothetical protein